MKFEIEKNKNYTVMINYHLIIEMSKNNKGLFDYTYKIYEIPLNYKELHPEVDNTTQINTKEQIDNIDNTEITEFTLELINRKYIEINYVQYLI